VEAALRQIRRGGRIFIGSGCAEPSILSRGLTEFADLFADNPILHLHAQGEAAYLRPEYSDNFRHNAFVLGPNVREAVQAGRADYTPIFISDVPALFSSASMPRSFKSPHPMRRACVHLASASIFVKAAAQSARIVIAQVNSRMPRTLGDSLIHIDEIDFLIEYSEAVREVPPVATDECAISDEVVQRIAANVARLVKNGATLHVGSGAIPDAILYSVHRQSQRQVAGRLDRLCATH
jgi:acyl-CoA hydrolase